MSGKVYLIGTGPGDVGLLTIKAAKIIKTADVLIYDRLINKRILLMGRKDAKYIDVGKLPDHHKVPQWRINEIIYKEALGGKIVARIKGGDPFVFGRGGEEAEYLEEKNIEYEIIPGITSAVSVPAYAGIPITHRNFSSSFHVITGHECDEKENYLDFSVLSKLNGTLVFLMGINNLKTIVDKLIENGKSINASVAVIMNGTTPEQKVITGTLNDIYEKAEKHNIKNPSVIVVGEVVKLRDRLKWYENKKLFGKRALLTRTYDQSNEMYDILAEYGAEVIICPTIKLTPYIDNAIKFLNNINQYDYIVLTSTNGVEVFSEAIKLIKYDIRKLYGVRIAAIGSKTSQMLEKINIYPDIMPKEYTSDALADKLYDLVKGKKIAILTSDIGGDILINKLRDCAYIEKIVLYKNEPNYEIRDILYDELNKGVDIAVFTSSSTFKYMHDILKDDINLLKGVNIAAIGPVTKKTIEEYGLKVNIMPEKYETDSLIKEILKYY